MVARPMGRVVELMFGPQHPGVIGNIGFKLWLDGERVLDVETVPGFLHRGFEKMMENRTWEMNIVLSYRFCVEDPDNLEVAYAEAVDNLFNIDPPMKAKYMRTVMAEFSRIASHLFWLNFMIGGVGLRTLGYWGIAAREEILKWFDYVTGHRIYHNYSVPGGIRIDVPQDIHEKTFKVLKFVEERVKEIEEALLTNPIFEARTRGIGVLPASKAIELGVTGPVLRASGIPYDLRKVLKYEAYGEVHFEIPTGSRGDSYDRVVVRLREIEQSIEIIRQAIEKVKPGDPYRVQLPLVAPPGIGLARVESARGEYMIYIESHGGRKPYRVRLRPATIPLLTTVLKYIVKSEEVTLADFPVILKSLDPCAPELDR